MKRKIIAQLLLWGTTIGMLYLAFRGLSFEELGDALSHADYRWAYLMAIITFLNHAVRVRRWQLLIHAMGYQTRFWIAFQAIMFGYFMNYIIPRAGEVTRCLALYRKHQVPVDKSLGTVVLERTADVFMLLLVFLLSVALEYRTFWGFLHREVLIPIQEKYESFFIPFLIGAALMLIIGILAYRALIQFKTENPIIAKIKQFVLNLTQGLGSVFKLQRKLEFIGLTVLIWVTYWLMTYLWFFSFDETSDLSPSVGLVLMATSSFGRLVPVVQGGGMGTYHYVFSRSIAVYGIPLIIGNALAVIIHGFQSVYYLLVGGFCAILMMNSRKGETEVSKLADNEASVEKQ